MKQMFATPMEFRQEVRRLADTRFDFVAPTRSLGVHTDDTGETLLLTEGIEERFPIRDTAHAQIAARLKIPKQYYDRMRHEQPALLDANVITWLHASEDVRLVRCLEGQMRAFLSDRYQRIDHIHILEAIDPILADLEAERGLEVVSCGLTDARMYVKFTIPGLRFEVPRIGDWIQAGFMLTNSEIGQGVFGAEGFATVLSCTNGMTYGQKLSRRHVGGRIVEGDVFSDRTRQLDDATIISAAQDIVRAAVDETRFAAFCARVGETVTTAPSVNPVQTVEILGQSLSLSEEEQGHVLTAFTLDAGQNGLGLYGLLNAVTRASQEVSDYERATEMEAMGGALLDTSDREWLRLAGIAA